MYQPKIVWLLKEVKPIISAIKARCHFQRNLQYQSMCFDSYHSLLHGNMQLWPLLLQCKPLDGDARGMKEVKNTCGEH